MLLFKKDFYDAIVAGTKTTTLRFWKHRRVRPGSIHEVPRLGRLRITSVDPVDLNTLDENDANADGFDSMAALQTAIDDIYSPEERKGRRLYRVAFEFIGTKN